MESRTFSGADEAAGTPGTMDPCFCCGKPDRSQCLSDDCPRAILATSLARPPVSPDTMEQGIPQSRPRRQAGISSKWPSQAWIRSYVEYDGSAHQHALPRKAASPSSEDSQVKPMSTHAEGEQEEATQVEPPPPSEASTGMSLPNQALLALLHLRSFLTLCPWQDRHALAG